MQDQQSKIQTKRFYDITALSSADTDSQIIDTAGWDAMTVYGMVEKANQTFTAANRVDFKLYHGNTNTKSEMTAVEAKDVIGYWGTGGVVFSINQASGPTVPTATDGIAFQFGYVGGKKYVFLRVEREGNVTAAPNIGATAIMGIAAYSDSNAKLDWA